MPADGSGELRILTAVTLWSWRSTRCGLPSGRYRIEVELSAIAASRTEPVAELSVQQEIRGQIARSSIAASDTHPAVEFEVENRGGPTSGAAVTNATIVVKGPAGESRTVRSNRQGEYEREWTLAGLALAYLRVRDAPGLDRRARADVEAWLTKLAQLVRPNYEHPGRMSAANNHARYAINCCDFNYSR